MPLTPAYEPVIDQHDTWLAVNPVQGCPKGCTYCYLQDLGLTRAKPAVLATPAETVEQLLAHRYYHPDLILALYTCTDALATPVTRVHLTGLLDALGASTIRNPVCLITKCAVPDDVIDAINRQRARGLTVIVYLSYSGLGPDIEKGHRPHGTTRQLPPPARRRHSSGPLLAPRPPPQQPPGRHRRRHGLDHPLRPLYRRRRHQDQTHRPGADHQPVARAVRPRPRPASRRLPVAPRDMGLAQQHPPPLRRPPRLPDQQLRAGLPPRPRRPRRRTQHPPPAS
ncbi:hypothetical protein GCM10020000_86930 [Streptomyces olivoverticillatus]